MISYENTSPILVVATTSKVGSLVVKELHKRNVRPRALVRSAAKVKEMLGEEVEIYDGFDYGNPGTAAAALSGVEKLYLVNTFDVTSVEQTKGLIDVAKRADVQHIVRQFVLQCSDAMKGFGASWRGHQHRAIEQYIESNGFTYTHLRPTWFYQNFEWISAEEIRRKSTLSVPYGDARLSFIDTRDIAEVAALALTEPGHENKGYEMTRPQLLSMAEVAKTLSQLTGRTVRFVNVPVEETQKWGAAMACSWDVLRGSRGNCVHVEPGKAGQNGQGDRRRGEGDRTQRYHF